MKLSVIVPVLNEEKIIEEALRDLVTRHAPFEVLVADGGSTDRTCEIAARYAKIIHSQKGRGAQMNAGAREARGDVLLFLHADTRLPDGGLQKLLQGLASTGKSAGRFRGDFGSGNFLLRLSAFQTRFHGFSYGDQGFFVTRERFAEAGGFPEEGLFEDVGFYRKLLQWEKPVILKEAVVTSPRRFNRVGVFKQRLINLFLSFLYFLGVKQKTLGLLYKRWYADVR